MSKYHIGTTQSSPDTNIAICGVTFPAVTGSPGGPQSPGAVVDLDPDQVAAIEQRLEDYEIRVHRSGSAILPKDAPEIAQVVLRTIPIKQAVYMNLLEEPKKTAAPAKKKSKK